MKEHHFGPIDFLNHERVEKLKLRSSGGRDHISSATLADRTVDDRFGIPGSGLSQFSFCVEDFYLQLLRLSSLRSLPRARGCGSFHCVEHALILDAIVEIRNRQSLFSQGP